MVFLSFLCFSYTFAVLSPIHTDARKLPREVAQVEDQLEAVGTVRHDGKMVEAVDPLIADPSAVHFRDLVYPFVPPEPDRFHLAVLKEGNNLYRLKNIFVHHCAGPIQRSRQYNAPVSVFITAEIPALCFQIPLTAIHIAR